MIQHIVLFKLNEIEVLRFIQVGQNYELMSSSHDICLITHFETLGDLEVYRVHPEHLKVVELIKSNTSSRAVIDFEF